MRFELRLIKSGKIKGFGVKKNDDSSAETGYNFCTFQA